MEYKLIEKNKDEYGLHLLIEVEKTQLWVDCYKINDDWEIDFNMYIFDLHKIKDVKIKKLQEKIIDEDCESFYFFIDEILEYEE